MIAQPAVNLAPTVSACPVLHLKDVRRVSSEVTTVQSCQHCGLVDEGPSRWVDQEATRPHAVEGAAVDDVQGLCSQWRGEYQKLRPLQESAEFQCACERNRALDSAVERFRVVVPLLHFEGLQSFGNRPTDYPHSDEADARSSESGSVELRSPACKCTRSDMSIGLDQTSAEPNHQRHSQLGSGVVNRSCTSVNQTPRRVQA